MHFGVFLVSCKTDMWLTGYRLHLEVLDELKCQQGTILVTCLPIYAATATLSSMTKLIRFRDFLQTGLLESYCRTPSIAIYNLIHFQA